MILTVLLLSREIMSHTCHICLNLLGDTRAWPLSSLHPFTIVSIHLVTDSDALMAVPSSQAVALSSVWYSTTLDLVCELKAEYVIQPLFRHSRNSWSSPTSLCALRVPWWKYWILFQASNTPMGKSSHSENSIVYSIFFSSLEHMKRSIFLSSHKTVFTAFESKTF